MALLLGCTNYGAIEDLIRLLNSLMDYFNESVWLNILQGKGKSVDRMPPEKRERKLI